jgi:hypothetical protein
LYHRKTIEFPVGESPGIAHDTGFVHMSEDIYVDGTTSGPTGAIV